MAGLLVFAVLGGYVLISVLIVYRVVRTASQKKLVAGILAAIVVTLPVTTMFWEYIQTKRTFERYCREEAKVTIFKTVEQWKNENPGVAETLKPYTYGNKPPYQSSGDGLYNTSSTDFLNPRFGWRSSNKIIRSTNVFHRSDEIVDTKTGEVMARMVDFNSGYGNPFLGTPYGLKSYKVWLAKDRCDGRGTRWKMFEKQLDGFEKINGGTK
jgi:hypothetical protein